MYIQIFVVLPASFCSRWSFADGPKKGWPLTYNRLASGRTSLGHNKSMRPSMAICCVLSDLNLYLNTCGQLELHKCLDCLGCR